MKEDNRILPNNKSFKILRGIFENENLIPSNEIEKLPKFILASIISSNLNVIEILKVSLLNKFFFNFIFNKQNKFSDLIWKKYLFGENEFGKDNECIINMNSLSIREDKQYYSAIFCTLNISILLICKVGKRVYC
eukprot:TRINITY_DN7831_c0_g1_i1.p2 TRINITY_DN7831_c0_g1~~TRINITY_DN7831_c0_g1_i1.p2  ORF type:complete len:135 (+),score=37.37 TRINITY_DN7831_c0_g1_i1:57-461(+)